MNNTYWDWRAYSRHANRKARRLDRWPAEVLNAMTEEKAPPLVFKSIRWPPELQLIRPTKIEMAFSKG
jgi:hypothetical protein